MHGAHFKEALHNPFWMQAMIVGMGCKAKNRVIASVLTRFLNAADPPPKNQMAAPKGACSELPQIMPRLMASRVASALVDIWSF
jgi:hypothetical protein